MFFSNIDIKNLDYPYQFFIQNLIKNPLDHPLTLGKGLIGYAQQDTSLEDFQTTNYSVNELTEFMDPYTLNYFTHGTLDKLKKLYCLNCTGQQNKKHQEDEYKTRQKMFHITFDISMFT